MYLHCERSDIQARVDDVLEIYSIQVHVSGAYMCIACVQVNVTCICSGVMVAGPASFMPQRCRLRRLASPILSSSFLPKHAA